MELRVSKINEIGSHFTEQSQAIIKEHSVLPEKGSGYMRPTGLQNCYEPVIAMYTVG